MAHPLRYALPLVLVGCFTAARAQETRRVPITDSLTRQPVVGASAGVVGTSTGAAADATGHVVLPGLPAGPATLQISALGYRPRRLVVTLPMAAPLLVPLAPSGEELGERGYPQLTGLQAERSTGLDWDVNYQRRFGLELTLTLNPSFFYTELDLGYVFTNARRRYDAVNPLGELAACHKLATVATTELTQHLAGGIEASYTGRQYFSDGHQTPGYPIVAALLRYQTEPLSFVLNGGNLFDYRQTRQETVVPDSGLNPDFP